MAAGGADAMVHEVGTLSTRALFSVIRAADTPAPLFAATATRLMRQLVEETIPRLPGTKAKAVQTPCGTYDGLEVPKTEDLCAVSIIRAGDSLLSVTRSVLPGIPVGKILIQRDEETAKPILYYCKLPKNIAEKQAVLLVDPMLATGGSALCAIDQLTEAGVKEERITFVNVVACPEGIAALREARPKVQIVTLAIDEKMNEQAYIVPGLGDFGDRFFGTDDA